MGNSTKIKRLGQSGLQRFDKRNSVDIQLRSTMRLEQEPDRRTINPAAVETGVGVFGIAMTGAYADIYNEIQDSKANVINEQLFNALDNVGVSPQESFAFTIGFFTAFTIHGATRLVRQKFNRNQI